MESKNIFLQKCVRLEMIEQQQDLCRKENYGMGDYYRGNSDRGNSGLGAKTVLTILSVLGLVIFLLNRFAKTSSSAYIFSLLVGSLLHMGWIIAIIIGVRVWAAKKCYALIEQKGYSKDSCLIAAIFGVLFPLLALIVCASIK